MSLITLMTDFGLKDANIGVMKGVIFGINPSATVIDMSHQILPQNVLEASYLLARGVPYFPKNTIHVVVVDPGVGTFRRPMVCKVGDWFFVGPDNGFLTGVIEYGKKYGLEMRFFHLSNPKFWLEEVSYVFHGRDIFSPVAAHLSTGVPMSEFGPEFTDPVLLDLPKPTVKEHSIVGEVIYIDNFGSLITNITRTDVNNLNIPAPELIIKAGDCQIQGMVNTFGDREVGSLVCLYSSTGNVIISVVNGSAADATGYGLRTKVQLGNKLND